MGKHSQLSPARAPKQTNSQNQAQDTQERIHSDVPMMSTPAISSLDSPATFADVNDTRIDAEKLGRVIRNIRKLYGYTQKELADKFGVSENYLSLFEKGKRGISFPNLTKLGALLNIPPPWMLMLAVRSSAGENCEITEKILVHTEELQSLIWLRVEAQALTERMRAVQQRIDQERQAQREDDSVRKFSSSSR